MKKRQFILISGFNVKDNNRGTAALSYGAISFLQGRKLIGNNQTLANFRIIKNFLRPENRGRIEEIISMVDGDWLHVTYNVFFIEVALFMRFGILFPFTTFGKVMRNVKLIAAINGGDGFSDIYSTKSFLSRLPETTMAIKAGIPTIQLPQTLGPFKEKENYELAKYILKAAKFVYVRDDRFVDELEKIGVKYELTNDLSYFMQPEPFDIEIEDGAIGLNVSGLAYSNHFRTLAGQFETYPYLCEQIVRQFQSMGKPVYLISHSYNYQNPEADNDDMEAARDFYSKLKDKSGVFLVDKDLTSPQTKYLISRMSFFIGTRMHANFAAIFTNVPVFGLAYSYKFKGAFENNGIYGSTAMINNISKDECLGIVGKIMNKYNSI